MVYDKNYQYDIAKTDNFYSSSNTIWYKNIFTSTEKEYLAGVSTYFEKQTHWDLSVYVNNNLKLTKSGNANSGYHTIDLGQLIPLNIGDIFEVVFKISVDSQAGFPISEMLNFNNCLYREGVSYVSFNGNTWMDLYNLNWEYQSHIYSSQVACIKAFTITEKIKTTTTLNISYDGFNPVDIKVLVLNEWGKPLNTGYVKFNLSGMQYSVNVDNGVAEINYEFEKGLNSITAVFEAEAYESSNATKSIYVDKIDVDVAYENNINLNTVLMNISINQTINETVIINFNGKSYSSKLNNGKSMIKVGDLDYGVNNFTITLKSSIYHSNPITGSVFINVKKTKILLSPFTTVYKSKENYTIILKDSSDNLLDNKSVEITLNGLTYNLTTVDGEITLPVDLECGNYTLTAKYGGDDFYLNTLAHSFINVKSSIIIQHTVYTLNSQLILGFLDFNQNPLINSEVQVFLNGVVYNLVTDQSGHAYINVNLQSGEYNLDVLNTETFEHISQKIKIVNRINANKDLTIYYKSPLKYKLRVCNDNGDYTGGISVTVKLNGKTYQFTSDRDGYISISLDLKPKTYVIQASSNGFSISNRIIIKSTIITKDIAVKKGKPVKFSAKLLNSNGKILKNKKITFKFKGVKYKVKTNKKGIATLKLSKKYKKGSYKISTSYGDLAVKNKIKIK